MKNLMERRKLATKLDKVLAQQEATLVELAASYHHHRGSVPPEVGEAIGAAACRRRLWGQLKQLILSQTTSVGLKENVDRLFGEMHQHEKTLEAVTTLRSSAS